ncbi:zf-HC2 domain-containing protein [Candidatus Aminicenantes bacterium AH-873-B07]|nr:zf-HC2 domain-containing protein [Candidatus Aminicenantes bacterium AH-873-B07]
MNCKDFSQLLYDFLINKIDFEKKKLFEEHVKRCSKCRKELEIEYKIKRAFKNIAKYEASSEFKEKILAQISENLMYFTLKFSIFRELLSLLERNTLYLIIFFFLIPFIMFPIYLGILELFNRIGEVTTKVEALSLF